MNKPTDKNAIIGAGNEKSRSPACGGIAAQMRDSTPRQAQQAANETTTQDVNQQHNEEVVK